MTLGERIKLLRGATAREKFAPTMDVSKNTLIAYENDERWPGADFLNKLLELFPDTDPGWLLTGKEPMKRDDGAAPAPALTPLHLDDYMVLPVYVTGGAGDPRELIPSEPIEEVFIPKSFYSPAIIPVKVKGRSMERTLRDGAVVGVDRADKDVVNGELYAVWLPYQGTVIKRLYLDNKKVLLQSDNEEFRSRDIEINISDIDEHFIQGRVKWVVQLL
ncbi:MAG: helix-turn-helix domain-containing protein [Geobacteraceae bacterium]|nr:helix-turn-helix domain-containing protein [Geobacteraceae bacterium]